MPLDLAGVVIEVGLVIAALGAGAVAMDRLISPACAHKSPHASVGLEARSMGLDRGEDNGPPRPSERGAGICHAQCRMCGTASMKGGISASKCSPSAACMR